MTAVAISEEIILPKTGRARKHPSTVATFTVRDEGQPVGEYGRLSDAKSDADIQDAARERQSIRDAVEADGAYVLRSYSDPDHSGSKLLVERPAYDQMIRDLDAGIISGIAVYDIDRLTRRHGILERLIERYELRDGKPDQYYWYCEDEDVDLRTEKGRKEAREQVNAAHKEARKTSKRVTRWHAQRRRNGALAGSRGFGYTTKASGEPGQIVEAEAEAIRLLAADVEAGRSVSSTLDSLNAQGIRPDRAKAFTYDAVRKILTSPRTAGLRVDMTDPEGIARDQHGNPIEGVQEAILPLDQWLRIRVIYKTRERGTDRRKYLASGTLRCQGCNAPIGGGWMKDKNRHRYVCPPNVARKQCGKVSIHGPKTDDYLALLVEEQLSRKAPAVAAVKPWPREDELGAVQEARAAATERKNAGTLDVVLWMNQDLTYQEAISVLSAERRAWFKDQGPMVIEASADTLRERWSSGDVNQQRSVLRELFVAILVSPGGEWSPDRFTPVLRHPDA